MSTQLANMHEGNYVLDLDALAMHFYNEGFDVSENTVVELSDSIELCCDRWGNYCLMIGVVELQNYDTVEVVDIRPDTVFITFAEGYEPVGIAAHVAEIMLTEQGEW